MDASQAEVVDALRQLNLQMRIRTYLREYERLRQERRSTQVFGKTDTNAFFDEE